MKKIKMLFLSCFIFLCAVPSNTVFSEDGIMVDDGILLPATDEYKFELQPNNSVYKRSDGKLLSGPNIMDKIEKEGKQLIPIKYQGETGNNDKIRKKIYDKIFVEGPNGSEKLPLGNSGLEFDVELNRGDHFYFRNFGEYMGKELQIHITSDYDLTVTVKYFSGNVSVKNKGELNASQPNKTDFYYSVEDLDGNVIDDPDYKFIMSAILGTQTRYGTVDGQHGPTETAGTGLDYSNYYFMGDPITNIMTGDTDNGYLRTNSIGFGSGNLVQKISEKVSPYDRYPYSTAAAASIGQSKYIGYIQDSVSKTRVVRNYYDFSGNKVARNYNYGGAYFLLFNAVTLPVRTAYGFPVINSTINDETDDNNAFKAKLEVSQIMPEQSRKDLYPNEFEIAVNLKDKAGLIDIDKINPKNFKLMLDGTDKTSYGKFSISKDNLVFKINREYLSYLGGGTVHIEGLLDLKHEDEALYDHIDKDGYINVSGLKAKNSLNARESELEEPLKVKVPGPKGVAVPVGAIEGDSTDDLEASNLVKDIKSLLPNDEAEVVGFEEKVVFDMPETGNKKDVKVVLRSKRSPQVTSTITVPVDIYSKQLPRLSPIVVQPEEDKVANSKEELSYKPTFIQSLSSNNATKDEPFNMVGVSIHYPPYLSSVSAKDFVLMSDNKDINPDNYSLSIDESNHIVTITFKKNSLANQLKNKEIVIKQNSKLKLDEHILDAYDIKKHTFDFKILANNTYSIEDGQTPLVSKNVVETQTIEYKPIIKAKAIKDKVVEPNTPVGDPSDYVTDVSKPEFDFDSYDISFKGSEPDFKEAGIKDFIVLIKSKKFGTALEVPVRVNVVNPTVNMKIKQVYKENNAQAIYKDIESKTTVDNSEDSYDVRIGDPITDVLKELSKKLPKEKFSVDYSGYTKAFSPNYKVSTVEGESTTNTVPQKDFTLLLEYDGTVNITAENLDFGTVPVSLVTLGKRESPDMGYVTLTDTNLKSKSDIQVKILDNLKDPDQDNKELLGGLFIQQKPKTLYISKVDQLFYTRSSKEENMKVKLPMNMGIYQNLGNVGGNYEGTVMWSIVDGPKPEN